MKTAVIYARVSTEDQAENGTSLDSQIERCKRYARENGAIVVQEYQESMSAARWDRPMLTEARELIRSGQADMLIAYSPDRLARDVTHLSLLFNEITKRKAELHTVTMPIEASPMGKAALQMAGVFGEMERAMITERSKRGKEQRARSGHVIGSNYVPYGYQHVKDERGLGRFEIIEEEAEWVRWMFDAVLRGLSLYAIGQKMSTLGAKTKRGGATWRKHVIADILHNPMYYGEYHWNKKRTVEPKNPRKPRGKRLNTSWEAKDETEHIVIPCPAIVDRETWDAVQLRLTENLQKHARNVKHNYLLRGMIKCTYCGRLYGGQGGGRYPYYTCRGKNPEYWRGRGEPCKNKVRNARLLDSLVWEQVCKVMTNPDAILALMSDPNNVTSEIERLNTELSACNTRGDDLKRRMNNLLDLVLNGDISRETFRERKLQLEKEQRAADELGDKICLEIANLNSSVLTPEVAKSLVEEFTAYSELVTVTGGAPHFNLLDEFNFNWCRKIIEKLKVEVEVDGERTILRGTISDLLLNLDPEWRGELGPASRRSRAIEAGAAGATGGETAQHSAHLRSTYRCT
jgi:site-specific DNA recombinase